MQWSTFHSPIERSITKFLVESLRFYGILGTYYERRLQIMGIWMIKH